MQQETDISRSSFDHLIGAHFNGGGQIETKRGGRFAINDQLEFHWLLHRQIGRFRSFQNLVHIARGLTVLVAAVRSV